MTPQIPETISRQREMMCLVYANQELNKGALIIDYLSE